MITKQDSAPLTSHLPPPIVSPPLHFLCDFLKYCMHFYVRRKISIRCFLKRDAFVLNLKSSLKLVLIILRENSESVEKKDAYKYLFDFDDFEK